MERWEKVTVWDEEGGKGKWKMVMEICCGEQTGRKAAKKEAEVFFLWNAHSESCLLLSSNSDKSKCSIMIHHSERHAVGPRTFLPGDCWPWGSWGFAVQNDWRAVNHGAVSRASRNVGSDTWVKQLKKQGTLANKIRWDRRDYEWYKQLSP